MAVVEKIFGPPGTGKTYALMELVAAEVKAGVPLHRQAYLSFSRSAADVIRDRMKATDDDLRWFRTIHGASTKIMGFGGAIISWHDYKRFSATRKMKITPEDQHDYDEDGGLDFNVVLRALNLAATTCTPIWDIIRKLPAHPNLQRTRVEAFITAWAAYKKDVARVDYTDMLTRYDGTPLPVDTVFLDEAQDLSELQWSVFKRMAANAKRIYMAGDDDQAIYGFIGASEYGFLDYPCDTERVLSKSYRVPYKIGQAADTIIKKIAHRKVKDVQWRTEPGELKRMNLEATTMPWRQWAKYDSVMVLTRHRRQAHDFSQGLQGIGVLHTLNGETMQSWREAKIAQTYFMLRDGHKVTQAAASDLLREVGVNDARFAGLSRRDKVSRDQMPLDFASSSWVSTLAGGDRKKRKKYESIRALINRQGYEVLAKEPKVTVSTMHAAKGKEADLVVIVPDCTPIVRQHVLEPSEIRLAYVALTRTKKTCAILLPRTDTYVHHYIGG